MPEPTRFHGRATRWWRRSCSLSVLVLLVAFGAGGAARAQTDPLDAPMVSVQIAESDTLRGLAGDYLGDPDLWPVVLRLNDIASPADLRPGMRLDMPVHQVVAADSALDTSLSAIQRANAEGARIFAPDQINEAIATRDEAVTRRESGAWRQVVGFAEVATGFAREALEISIAQRDRSAEAIVSDVQGTVEGRAPAEPRWTDRDLNDILVEFERVRTLTASTTQITFRDLSKLRLNPNSNATIQQMRRDPLTGGAVTKVSLVNGDFYALLNQLNDKTQFEIATPGIEATTNSGDFWIKSDAAGASFVNYDRRALEVDTGTERIAVGENEGVVLTGAGATRGEVLDSVLLAAPPAGEVIYSGTAALEWEPYENAAGYWLEIAADPAFNQMQTTEWGLHDTAYAAESLPPGRYFWRVAALDQLGLPGTWSTPRDFSLRLDNTPPFLTVLAPLDGAQTAEPEVELLGATETDAVLRLNGAVARPGSDGSFLRRVALVPGENRLTVEATDLAGNTSRRAVTVIHRPARAVEITLDPAIPRVGEALATREGELSLTGTTTAQEGAAVIVVDVQGADVARSTVEPGGRLAFSVPVEEAPRPYEARALSPDGVIEGRLRFTALRDVIAPEIRLDLPPPRATGAPAVDLAGSAGDAVSMEVNGVAVPLRDGRFALTLELQPGVNTFGLTARDAVGNVAATRLQTLLDLAPPEISDVTLTRPRGEDGPIELLVRAEDASGLVQAAPFLIMVRTEEIAGFLRCDATRGLCSASLPAQPGALELLEIVVEDYAGNAAYR